MTKQDLTYFHYLPLRLSKLDKRMIFFLVVKINLFFFFFFLMRSGMISLIISQNQFFNNRENCTSNPLDLIIDVRYLFLSLIIDYKVLMDKNTSLTHFCFCSTTLHMPLLANSSLFNCFGFFILFSKLFL